MKSMNKFISLLLCTLLIFSLFGCTKTEETVKPEENNEQEPKTATYTAEAKGFGGTVTVSGTFKDNVIQDLTVEAADETKDIGGKAAETLKEAILEAKSADVDGISGATYTSEAVLSAAKKVFNQAAGIEETAEIKMKPGTYTGSAKGYSGIIKATVEVSENEILSIKLENTINEDSTIKPDQPMYIMQNIAVRELDQIFSDVEKLLPERIIAAQSLSIDTISGATASSNGAISAVKNAVKEAGADPEAFNKTIAKNDAQETYDCDIVVVGGGTAGATAAAQAKELGAKVVLIEKSARLGGTGGLSAGPMALNTDAQLALGLKADTKAYYDHYDELMHWSIKGSLFSQLLNKSADTFDWLNANGVKLIPDTGWFAETHGKTSLTCYTALPYMGLEVRSYFEDLVSEVDNVLLETTATSLIKDAGGKVTGVKAEKYDGTKITVNAKAVIMATGGFGGNEEMMQEKLGAVYNLLGVRQNDGSGLNMMIDAGAKEYNASAICTHAIGIPKEVTGFNGFDRTIPYSLVTSAALLQVNDNGERFMNEEVQDTDMTRGSVMHAAQGSYYYVVLSQKQVNAIKEKGTSAVGQQYDPMAFSFQYISAGKDVPMTNIQAVLDAAVKEDLAYKGATLEELAQNAGMDPEILKMNVKKYDESCNAGKDEIFGKTVSELNALGEGPYYAVKGTTVAYCTVGGVETAMNLQVMNEDGQLIDGLYAAGVESIGNIMDGKGYTNVSGIALSWGFNSGRIAAENAVEAINK
ncbi:FAD-dependent oxidoreductase [Sedimentibacter sp. B4]|uniref:FAD-dependent oxidoreductase n=1 Tax=Sedimentibacter sp. B4 TaxID=304766 RepID=UPI0002E84042|nr:FAD-dependent oxidoreductase [Sedimentibacter sp. B4]